MCFTDKALTGTGAAQQTLFNTATQQGQAEFGAANTEFNDLTKTMNPIEEAGPDQPGWSAAQNNAINSQTINQTAAAYKNAAVAVKGDIAGEGGPAYWRQPRHRGSPCRSRRTSRIRRSVSKHDCELQTRQ